MRQLLTVAVLAALVGWSTASGAQAPSASRVVDHRIFQETKGLDLSAPRREKVQGMRIALGHAPQGSQVLRGLDLLAQDDAGVHLRTSRWPSASWFKESGLGSYSLGERRKPETTVGGFMTAFDRKGLSQVSMDAAMVELGASQVSQGANVETNWIPHSSYAAVGRMSIRYYSVQLDDVMIEKIRAPVTIGGNAQGGGIMTMGEFPIELPNVSVTGVATSIAIPCAMAGTSYSHVLSTRHPEVAFAVYRQGMSAIEAMAGKAQSESDRGLAVVWSTVPLERTGNQQRVTFNEKVRRHCREKNQALLDIADILAHGPAGDAASADGTPALHAAYQGDGGVNEVGQRRCAQAWWELMARIAG